MGAETGVTVVADKGTRRAGHHWKLGAGCGEVSPEGSSFCLDVVRPPQV
jgi:hypothetical protein